VRWIEKTSPPGAADLVQGPPGAGRAIATTFLAWGRQTARAANRKAELEALTARAQPLVAANSTGRTVRVSLTWAHPEFHPRLWSNALGSPMPAPGGDALLGIAEVLLPDRPDASIEVRLEADDLEHAARLGQIARLTAVFDELTPKEKVVALDVRFDRAGPASQRFGVRGGEVVRE
jgi:hypothetical protein